MNCKLITDKSKYPREYSALATLPWRGPLSIPLDAPINKLDIVLARYFYHFPQITQWPVFLSLLSKTVFPSIVSADKDGTLLPITNQPAEFYKKRAKLLVDFFAMGFPFFILSAASLELQKIIVESLVEYASSANLLPVLQGIGFTEGSAQLFRFNASGELVEDLNYGQGTRMSGELIKTIADVAEPLIEKFSTQMMVEMDQYPGFEAKFKKYGSRLALHYSGQDDEGNCRKISIKTIPSFKFNPERFLALGTLVIENTSIEIEDRVDLRTHFFKEIVAALRDRGILEKLNINQGGETSIDITRAGVNKKKVSEYLIGSFADYYGMENIHFGYLGDEAYVGGNDWLVVKLVQELLAKSDRRSGINFYALYNIFSRIPHIPGVISLGYDETQSDLIFNLYGITMDNWLRAYFQEDSGINIPVIGKVVSSNLETMFGGRPKDSISGESKIPRARPLLWWDNI